MNETEQRQTAADIKKQIQEAQANMKEQAIPLSGQIANEINANGSTPAAPEKAASKPQEETPAEKSVAKSTDFKEWAKKKGIDWTTDDSILAALHKSDQEFHKRQATKKEEENKAREGYMPSYTERRPSPPPALPVNTSREVIEQIARQYNMLPEDVERLAKFNRDFFESVLAPERERHQREIDEIRTENKKNSVFRELSSDPVFRRPDVAMEFHNVLEQMQNADPRAFEENPDQYRRAYEQALSNIGRRYLEGNVLEEGTPPKAKSVSLPSNPPKPLGQGSGGGAYESESSIDPRAFAKMSLEDKKKLLEGMGLRSTYQ